MLANGRRPAIWAGVCALLLAGAAWGADWTRWHSKRYGFAMDIPPGTQVETREWAGGWGGMSARVGDVQFYGLAKLGPQESDATIEAFAVEKTGVAASAWTRIDQGRKRNGWHRWSTFKATAGAKLLFGAYGVGAKGSYLLYLETTPQDFAEHRAEYDRWYGSVRLD